MSSEALERGDAIREALRRSESFEARSASEAFNELAALLAEVARLEQECDEALSVREGLISPVQKVLQLRDALAVAREREQRAEQERATYAKAWADQQYRLQAATAALADLLDTMERGDEYKAFERMTAARAALVDEPAAATLAEPGEGTPEGFSTPGSASAAADEPGDAVSAPVHGPAGPSVLRDGAWVRSCLCGRVFQSTENWQHVPRFYVHLATARGGVPPSGKPGEQPCS